MKAKAAVFQGANRPFEVREFKVTAPPAGYGRSELIASGICGTDIHFTLGRLPVQTPTILGHEFVGKLVELDEDEGAKYGLHLGDYVIADIAVPCGSCLLCQNGDEANCVHMKVTNGGSIEVPPYLYGGYTEVNYTPLANLIKIPKELDAAMVCTFACPGPTAIHAFSLAKKAGIDVKKVKNAVIQGMGPVGIFALIYLKAIGVEKVFTVIAGHHEKREQLARRLGAADVFILKETPACEVSQRLREESGGLGVDLVFEASGAPEAFAQGLDMLRNRGVYLVPGQYSNSGGVTIQPQIITFKALQIIGSSQYAIIDVKDYLHFLSEHTELHSTISSLSKCYSIDEINLAINDAKSGDNIKTMLVK